MSDKKIQLVESMIDDVLRSNKSVTEAVSEIVDGGSLPQIVEMTEANCACQKCGNTELQENVIDDEAYLYCQECDTAYFPEEEANESADDEDEDEDVGESGLVEAEIDDDNPACPACDSERLSVEMVESDGEDVEIIVCESCGAAMVPAGE